MSCGRATARIAALAAALAPSVRAAAHTTSTGLARISVGGEVLTYRLTLVLSELPEGPRALLTAAAEGDPAGAEQVAAELRRRVEVRSEDAACRPGRAVVQGSRLGDGRVELELTLRCPSPPRRLLVRDGWASLLGEHHRTLVRIDGPGGVRELALSGEAPQAEVELGGPDAPGGGGFFRLGVEHILSGWDHLLFLAALLLCGGGLLSLLKIVTAFTVAHSLSLALAVLGVVAVPGRVVEPLIAASIVYVALENVRGREAMARRWLVAFGFGLVHGFGFASALKELALPAGRMAWALLGFNVGVEAGQGLVVAAFLPVMIWARRAAWEPRAVRLASFALALTGSALLVQRLFFA